MTNYESLTNLCDRLPPLTSSLAPTNHNDNLCKPNLKDTLGPDLVKIKTSNELKRLKTVNEISKKHTKMSSARKISAKLEKLRQSTTDSKNNSGIQVIRTDKEQVL